MPARPICASLGEAANPFTWLPGRGISPPLLQLILSGPDMCWGAWLGKLRPSSTPGLPIAYQALGCQIRNLCPLFHDCSPVGQTSLGVPGHWEWDSLQRLTPADLASQWSVRMGMLHTSSISGLPRASLTPSWQMGSCASFHMTGLLRTSGS